MPNNKKQNTKAKRGNRRNGRPKLTPAQLKVRGGVMTTVRRNIKTSNPGVPIEKRLIRSFVLPADVPPIRQPARMSKMTAVFPFEQVTTETITTTVAGAYLVFMDPVYPLWRYANQSITGGYKHQFDFSDSASIHAPSLPITVGACTPVTLAGRLAAASSGSFGTPTKPAFARSGIYLGSTSDSASLWWYVPGNMSPVIQVVATAGNTAGGAWTFNLQYTPDGSNENSYPIDVTGSAGSSALLIDAVCNANYCPAGWYRLINFTCTTAPTTPTATIIDKINVGWISGGTLASPTASTIDGFLVVDSIGSAEFIIAPNIYEKCRLNSGSFLFQNVTAAVNKEGAVKAGIFSSRGLDIWANNATQQDHLGDLQPRLRYTGMLEKGLYTYMQPQMSSNSGEHFGDSAAAASAAVTGDMPTRLMQLGAIDYHYYISLQPSSQTQTIQLTYICHHETPNDSMLYTSGQCRLPYEAYRQASISTQSILPFTENPIHMATLMAAAGRLAAQAAVNAWNRAKQSFNPLAHQAVDWLIPKYKSLALENKPKSPYS